MNRATGKLLRACVRLVERDVAELTDAVVQIDERCADLVERMKKLEAENAAISHELQGVADMARYRT